MAEFSMWGPQESPLAIAQDQQLKQVQIQQHAAQTQDLMAQTYLRNEQANKVRQDEAQKAKIQADMQRIALEQAGKGSEAMAGALELAGHPMEAMSYRKEAAVTRERISKAEEADTKAAGAKLDQGAKLWGEVGRQAQLIDASPDAQGAWKALQEKFEAVTGKPLPEQIKNAPWSPQLSEKLQNLSMTQKDRVEAQRKELHDAAVAKELEARAARELEQVKTEKAKQDAEYALAAQRRKSGGDTGGKTTPAKAISPQDKMLVADLVKAKYPGVDTDTPGARAEIALVATRAEKLVASKAYPDRGAAINAALAEAIANGEITTTVEHSRTFSHPIEGEDKTKVTFQPGGATAPTAAASAAPAAKAGAAKGHITTTKPAGASDADWAAYKKAMGIN